MRNLCAAACTALAFALFGLGTHAARGQEKARIDDGIAQLRSGDAFRALLTLNEVIAQNPGDSRLVARAHALRAMAFLRLQQPERARASAREALKADGAFVPRADEVDSATIALFDGLHPAARANSEADGEAAERAGQFQQAFLSYLSAYQALPSPAPRDDDRRLRERIIRVVQKLPAAPIVPDEAREHKRRADQLLEAETILGNPSSASSHGAADELTKAIRIAPWWAEPTFALAGVLQRLQLVDDAVVNLNLYRLADPQGYAAAVAKTATPPAARPASTPAAAPPAAAPGSATAATGTIIVYRIPAFRGGASKAKVDCDGRPMAELQNGRTVSFTAPAGKHAIRVHDDTVVVDVPPGGESYVKGEMGWNFHAAAVSAADARTEMKQRDLKPNDAKNVMSTTCKPQ